jgi:hypothetical protein
MLKKKIESPNQLFFKKKIFKFDIKKRRPFKAVHLLTMDDFCIVYCRVNQPIPKI